MPSLENSCPKVSFQVQLTQGERTTRISGTRLISVEEYCQKFYSISTDKPSFAGIKGHLTSKQMLEALDFDLKIKHDIKHIFVNKPTFKKLLA